MAGYSGFSMSNNAVDAYKNGEKPLSKWTKKEILAAIQKAIGEKELTLCCSITLLQKVPVRALKDVALCYSSWHHTSNHYNRTDFYMLDTDALEQLTDSELEAIIENTTVPTAAPTEEKWKCAFLEWGGTRQPEKQWFDVKVFDHNRAGKGVRVYFGGLEVICFRIGT